MIKGEKKINNKKNELYISTLRIQIQIQKTKKNKQLNKFDDAIYSYFFSIKDMIDLACPHIYIYITLIYKFIFINDFNLGANHCMILFSYCFL